MRNRPKIPAGYDRIELVDDAAPGATWRWHRLAANYEKLATSGESFSDKTAARTSAERVNGVTFPPDQDWVDVPVSGATGLPLGTLPILGGLTAAIMVVVFLLGYIMGDHHGRHFPMKPGPYLAPVVTTTTLPVCGDYNHDGLPDSPSGDPPLGQQRQVPPTCRSVP